MKKIYLKILIIVFLVTLVFVICFLIKKEKLFKEYKNYELGVSFKYPNTIDNEKIEVFQVKDIVFLTSNKNQVFVKRNELLNIQDSYLILKKAKELSTQNSETITGYWAIYTSKTKNDSEINNLIDFWYGKVNPGVQCILKDKEKTIDPETFNISLVSKIPSKDPDTDSCIIDWINYFKFNSKNNVSAVWDSGQEEQFVSNRCIESNKNNCSFDKTIADSFHFIDSF